MRDDFSEMRPFSGRVSTILPVNLTANCDYDLRNEYTQEDTDHPLDLGDLVKHYHHIKLDKQSFAAAIARYADPRATVLNFSSAKMVCVGTDSYLKARYAFQLQRCLIEAIPHPNRPLDPKYLARRCEISICNYVIFHDVGHHIDLSKFARNNSVHVSYEPPLFPAAIYRDESEVPFVSNIFDSGLVIITKIKHVNYAAQILPALVAKLHECRVEAHNENPHEHRLALHSGIMQRFLNR